MGWLLLVSSIKRFQLGLQLRFPLHPLVNYRVIDPIAAIHSFLHTYSIIVMSSARFIPSLVNREGASDS